MSSQPISDNPLVALSNAMADAAARSGSYTVLVDARRRFPASGILYTSDLVVTADHVVEREDDIKVILPDGMEISAAIAGRDPGSDLALLRLSRSAGPTGAAAAEARVGQIALAIGRPTPEGVQASLGVISAVGGPVRTGRGVLLERYLATDAVPYPGFSGGPLVDAAGMVLGMNTSGLTRGTSIAIPAALVWSTAQSLMQFGRIRRGYLGIRSQPVELPTQGQQALGRNQTTGLLIVGVEAGSPAAQANLLVGDILVGIAGSPVVDHDELLGRLSGSLVGTPASLELLRGGNPIHVDVTIGERN